MNKKPTIRERIKMMLLWRDVSLSALVRKLNKIHNKNHSQPNLSAKLIKNTIRFNEVEEIANLLGYEIILKEKSDWEKWEEK